MPIKKEREYRALAAPLTAQSATKLIQTECYVEGYATTFDTPYLLYEFEDGTKIYERIDAHALDGADMSDVIMQYDHEGRRQTMKGFPKVLKTKEDYYNCLAMVASGELAAADLLAKIESAENQRYIECGVAAVEEEKKAVTVYYCDEAAVGMKFVAGDVSGTVQGVTHIQTDEAAAAGEAGNDRTALTLSKAVKAGCKVIALERTDTVAGMTTDDIAALKGVLKQYE